MVIRKFEEILGYEVDVEFEWYFLIVEFDCYYFDKLDFVVSVIGCVLVWVKSMIEFLDDFEYEVWGE